MKCTKPLNRIEGEDLNKMYELSLIIYKYLLYKPDKNHVVKFTSTYIILN